MMWVNIYSFKNRFVANTTYGDIAVSGEGATRIEAMLALGSAIKNLPLLF